jgi:Zn ribbon nucleic-acid-binding protein
MGNFMTRLQEITMDCPQCRQSQKISIWQSLNATASPDDKEKLLKGEINVFHCVSCGHKAAIETPLSYHDLDLVYVVQFYPPQYLDDAEFFNNFTDDTMMGNPSLKMPPDTVKTAIHMLKPHIVFSMNELRNYIVFRDRLAKAKGTKKK